MAGPPKPGAWVVKATWDNVEAHVAAGQDVRIATLMGPPAARIARVMGPGDRQGHGTTSRAESG